MFQHPFLLILTFMAVLGQFQFSLFWDEVKVFGYNLSFGDLAFLIFLRQIPRGAQSRANDFRVLGQDLALIMGFSSLTGGNRN